MLGLSLAVPAPVAAVDAAAEIAAPSPSSLDAASDPRGDTARRPAPPETPLPSPAAYRLFGGIAFGRGIRFNNPYRLRTELGSDAESVSVTATYASLSAGGLVAAGKHWLHGASVDGSFALDGIAQEVVTPSYTAWFEPDPRWSLRGRAGVPIVVEPDLNAGFELAFGGVYRLTAGVGLTASVVGSLFFGAATYEASRTTIPIASFEVGVLYDYEVFR